jgi:hypothetical protein
MKTLCFGLMFHCVILFAALENVASVDAGRKL